MSNEEEVIGEEYTVEYVPWDLMTGTDGADAKNTFTSYQQIKDWIETCRKTGIGISIQDITQYTITRSGSKPMSEALIRSLKAATGQNGPHTTALELRK